MTPRGGGHETIMFLGNIWFRDASIAKTRRLANEIAVALGEPFGSARFEPGLAVVEPRHSGLLCLLRQQRVARHALLQRRGMRHAEGGQGAGDAQYQADEQRGGAALSMDGAVFTDKRRGGDHWRG